MTNSSNAITQKDVCKWDHKIDKDCSKNQKNAWCGSRISIKRRAGLEFARQGMESRKTMSNFDNQLSTNKQQSIDYSEYFIQEERHERYEEINHELSQKFKNLNGMRVPDEEQLALIAASLYEDTPEHIQAYQESSWLFYVAVGMLLRE